MLAALLAALVVFLILVVAEYVSRHNKQISAELTRKIVHISVGTFAAFWPFFMSWRYIELLSLAFLIVVLASQRLSVFKSIHSVERSTLGEPFFALAIGLLALISCNRWIYATGLLNLSLADGLAALVGEKFGSKHAYKIWGHTKTVIGSTTFLVSSYVITFITVGLWGHAGWGFIAILPIIATFAENLAVRGSDNLIVPLVVVLVLRWF